MKPSLNEVPDVARGTKPAKAPVVITRKRVAIGGAVRTEGTDVLVRLGREEILIDPGQAMDYARLIVKHARQAQKNKRSLRS